MVKRKQRIGTDKPVPPVFYQWEPAVFHPAMRLTAVLPWGLLLAAAVAVIGLVAYLALDNGRPWHHGPIQASPAPVALDHWGPELTLELVGKFPVAENAWDLAADEQGDVYVLTEGNISCYHNGKKARSLFIGNTSARSMAFDGDIFYITEFIDSGIAKIRKDFLKPEGFAPKENFRLLGIAYSAQRKALVTADVTAKNLLTFDLSGQLKDHVAGPLSIGSKDGYVMDLKADEAGNVFEIDRDDAQISFFSPDNKLQKNMVAPWHNPNRERMALAGGYVYINCYSDQCILVMDTQGTPVGRIKMAAPLMLGAGKDGFLYAESEGYILKLKPLSKRPPAPQPQKTNERI